MHSLPIVDPSSATPIELPTAEAVRREGGAKGTYHFVSLGCPKNLVDSERMLGLLQTDGYRLVSKPEGADFVVVNTCGFIDEARAESYGAIREMLELKEQKKIRGVVVSGCLAERQKDSLLEECPGVDFVVGVFGREEITRVADRMIANLDEQRAVFRPAPIRALPDEHRLRITPRHFAYLKISEGCDRLCTFCAIPQMRGKHASKPIEGILQEARALAASGVRELIIVAQDTTYYGKDLYGEPRLTELLRELNKVEGIAWIRLMYFYPMYIDDALIGTIADSQKIIPYLDIPLQHIDDKMLRRMSRRVSRSETEALLQKLRRGIPGLTLRTTFITGFPGETDEQFQTLVDFVKDQQFERLGVFTYSYEPSTPSAAIPDHLPEHIKKERRDALMGVQQDIARVRNQTFLGQTIPVIVDKQVEGEKSAWVARSQRDAPDVDALVWLTGAKLKTGDIVDAEVVAVVGYDLAAVHDSSELAEAERRPSKARRRNKQRPRGLKGRRQS
jgi:ribosomal protein S12 methylthiotransferase